MNVSHTHSDLTTSRAPFIENARSCGTLFIRQPYELYSDENHRTWRRLVREIEPLWERCACDRFLEGLTRLDLDRDAIPRLEDVNRQLAPVSGFQARAVSGYVPSFLFFDCLGRREFPTTITIRDGNRLDYLPEPDIFHDLGGHVPMHTDRVFADVVARFGEVARSAALRSTTITDREERVRVVESNIKALARFFWFTVEFGIARRSRGGVCAYGSGLLSSSSELAHAVESPTVQRHPFRLEWVVNQYFEIDHFQPLLFVVDSFEALREQLDLLERALADGQLDHVSPGEPAVDQSDLRSFLEAGETI
jgi:phenylalanine-4-hydroxylase